MTNHNHQNKLLNGGMILVEMIFVIIIFSTLIAVSVRLLNIPFQAYRGVEQRATLVYLADTALHQMTDEIRSAVPNSIRITSNSTIVALEFLHSLESGHYRATAVSTTIGDILDFGTNTDSFDVLGQLAKHTDMQTGNGSTKCLNNKADCLIINTNNVYSDIATLSAASATSLSFDNSDRTGWHFNPSSDQRFYVIDTPVSYVCNLSTEQIIRYADYPITPTQSTVPGESNLLIDQVTACDFTLAPSGKLVKLNISITDTELDASIILFQQISVSPP